MEIFVDGNVLDAELEEEQSVGAVLLSFSEKLKDTGFRMSGFSVNGKGADYSHIEELFSRGLGDVKQIAIETKSIKELYIEALLEMRSLLVSEENKAWSESSAHSFLKEEDAALKRLADNYFSNGTGNCEKLKSEIEERLFEIEKPLDAILSIKDKIAQLEENLAVLSLDIQLGKDKKAAETVFDFTIIAEKITRLFYLLDNKNKDKFIDNASFENFRELLKEFLESYEREDYVLTGDLAEYEIAPRLSSIYDKLRAVYNS